jgi:hypothetical protein
MKENIEFNSSQLNNLRIKYKIDARKASRNNAGHGLSVHVGRNRVARMTINE